MSVLSKKILDNPQNYMYIFASERFLEMLDRASAEKIAVKRQYQVQLVTNACGGNNNYDAAKEELRQAMIDLYGMTPAQALVNLAQGKEVAGKNWAQGIYGVGAIGGKQNTFTGTVGTTVAVDAETGAIMMDGAVVSSDANRIIGSNKKNGYTEGYSYTDSNGNTYTSYYDKITKKYYCNTRSTADGKVYRADGKEGSQADMSSIWSGVISELTDMLKNVIEKLFNLGTDQTVLPSVGEVAPSQSDGFTTTGGSTDSKIVPILIGGAAAAAIFAPQIKKAMKKK